MGFLAIEGKLGATYPAVRYGYVATSLQGPDKWDAAPVQSFVVLVPRRIEQPWQRRHLAKWSRCFWMRIHRNFFVPGKCETKEAYRY